MTSMISLAIRYAAAALPAKKNVLAAPTFHQAAFLMIIGVLFGVTKRASQLCLGELTRGYTRSCARTIFAIIATGYTVV